MKGNQTKQSNERTKKSFLIHCFQMHRQKTVFDCGSKLEMGTDVNRKKRIKHKTRKKTGACTKRHAKIKRVNDWRWKKKCNKLIWK